MIDTSSSSCCCASSSSTSHARRRVLTAAPRSRSRSREVIRTDCASTKHTRYAGSGTIQVRMGSRSPVYSVGSRRLPTMRLVETRAAASSSTQPIRCHVRPRWRRLSGSSARSCIPSQNRTMTVTAVGMANSAPTSSDNRVTLAFAPCKASS